MGTVHEDICTVMIISHQNLLQMRDVSKVVEKVKTHILCSVTFFRKLCYEIMWKNVVEPERPQMII